MRTSTTRVVAVLAALAVGSGCAARAERARGLGTASAGGTMLGVAGLLAFVSAFPPADGAPAEEDNRDSLRRTAAVMAVSGGALAVIGLIAAIDGQSRLGRERAATRRAYDLSLMADAAARNGDCARVRELATVIGDTDRDVYNSVFLTPGQSAACVSGHLEPRLSAPTPTQVSTPAAPPPLRDPKKDREHAFALTREARQAAHAGDCPRAIELEPEVRALDANVHDAWFVRDAAISACLAPHALPAGE